MVEDYLKKSDTDWVKQRLTGLIAAVFLAFLILFVRLFYLQIIQGHEYYRLSENQCIRLQSIDPPRGLIFDRNKNLLVDNRPSFDLEIVLKDAAPVEETIQKLARYLNETPESLLAKISKRKGLSAYKPILLKQDIGRDALAAIEVHKFVLPGIRVEVRPRRHYINRQIAAHLIGYLSEISSNELEDPAYADYRSGDYIGKFGVEKEYEKYLRGVRGGRQVEVNVTGQVVRVLKTVDAVSGNNLYLTIDTRIQQRAEQLIEGLVGGVVAMDPTNGDILAIASSPSFDQNAFVSGMSHDQWDALVSNPFRPMENKAIQGEYPPGSTYKIVTAMAGLEEGVIDENTTFFCPGIYRYGDTYFKCWKRGGHGNVDVVRAIVESCDVFFYQVGQKVGVDRLAWYAKACGLGKPTGIDLDHEANGLIPTAAWKKQRFNVSWQGGETLSIAIGQGYNLVTPLQLVVMISAIANKGIRYKPQIVDRIESSQGDILYLSEPEVTGKIPVNEHTLNLIREGLWGVVNARGGTAGISRLDDVDISGKTGTAQVIGHKKTEPFREKSIPDHLKAHALFVAYAPAENARIAVAVVVEHGEHGSSAASPIAREIIRAYLESDPLKAHTEADNHNEES